MSFSRPLFPALVLAAAALAASPAPLLAQARAADKPDANPAAPDADEPAGPADIMNEVGLSGDEPPEASAADAAKWVQAIRERQAKARSLVARYELRWTPRGRSRALLESGTVRMLIPENGPVAERWEGKGEEGRVLRIVRGGKVMSWINGRSLPAFDVADRDRITSAMLGFPRLPAACEATYAIAHAAESDPWAVLDDKAAPASFPTALTFEPKERNNPSPRLKRVYLLVDPENGLAYRLRWYEMEGPYTYVDLYDQKFNAPVSDADFEPPADGGAGAQGGKGAGEQGSGGAGGKAGGAK